MIVLTLNSGSSSLKFGLYRVEDSDLDLLMTGQVEGGELQARDAQGVTLSGSPMSAGTTEAAIEAIVSLLAAAKLPPPDAIGLRIVHGGPKLLAHRLIDHDVERDLELAAAMSPLHAPAALAMIRLAKASWPRVPQVACLDTAFHSDMPALARTLPIAKELRALGMQRYGFHGLSCESVVRQLGAALPSRTVVAHLGSGASVTAILDGRSVDTSMGLTPSGGVVMATRTGDLDPGILIYLLRERSLDAAMLEDMIDHRSGLLGISGLSGDLRQLHRAAPSNPDARLAIAMFCMSVAKAIAGMTVTLGGVDAIVFTGGIGENDTAVRAAVCDHLGWLGVSLADDRNGNAARRVDTPGSRCEIHVLPSLEEDQIARHTAMLVEI